MDCTCKFTLGSIYNCRDQVEACRRTYHPGCDLHTGPNETSNNTDMLIDSAPTFQEQHNRSPCQLEQTRVTGRAVLPNIQRDPKELWKHWRSNIKIRPSHSRMLSAYASSTTVYSGNLLSSFFRGARSPALFSATDFW